MSTRILVIGPECSGKSTVAAQVALLLAKIRKAEDPPLASVTGRALCYQSVPVEVKRVGSAAEFLQHLRQASGPAIGDDFSDVFGFLTDSYIEETRKERAASGLPLTWHLGPDDFRIINHRYAGLFRTARSLGNDLIEIYRLGDSPEGVRLRGASGSARNADLVISLDGGLYSDRRRVRVLSDASYKASKAPLELPRIETPKELQKLTRLLRDLLQPSLEALIREGKKEAEAWASGGGPADYWPEVRELTQRQEAEQLISELRTLCEIHGLSGRQRTAILYDHFGAGDFDGMAGVSVMTLRSRLPAFNEAVRAWADDGREAAGIRSSVRLLLDSHGIGGQSGEARTKRARVLGDSFATDLEGLEAMPLATLKERFDVFKAALQEDRPS